MAQIIVVEDDVYMREELIDVLEKAGYDAVPLLDFENAVSQIMSLSPDLILLDINLPFHSGFEICKEVKAKQLGTRLYRIYLHWIIQRWKNLRRKNLRWKIQRN